MADDKAKSKISKHDAGQLDRWHRNAASEQEVRKAVKARTGKGAAPGNQNSLVHGIYADRFLSPEERPLFEAIIGHLYQDFVFNKSSDFMQVELVAVYFLKLDRAQEAGDWDGRPAGKTGRVAKETGQEVSQEKENAEMIGDNTRTQENTTPETPGVTVAAGCMIEDNSRSSQSFSGRTPATFTDLLDAAFDESIEGLFTRLYVVEQMSVPDIRQWLEKRLGSVVSERHLYRIMTKHGVQLRGYAERKRLSWKQGKMDASMAKSRQTRKRTYLLGSNVEQAIRYLLREALLALEIKWDVVISDNLQHILGRYEVDIPVVVVDRSTCAACRFAVEVDNSFTHASTKRKKSDAAKDRALENAGWGVFRLDGGVKEQDVLAEQVADLVLAIEAHSEEISVNHSFSTGPLQGRRATHHQECVQAGGL